MFKKELTYSLFGRKGKKKNPIFYIISVKN